MTTSLRITERLRVWFSLVIAIEALLIVGLLYWITRTTPSQEPSDTIFLYWVIIIFNHTPYVFILLGVLALILVVSLRGLLFRSKMGLVSAVLILFSVLVTSFCMFTSFFFLGDLRHKDSVRVGEHVYHLALWAEPESGVYLSYNLYECDSGGLLCRLHYVSPTYLDSGYEQNYKGTFVVGADGTLSLRISEATSFIDADGILAHRMDEVLVYTVDANEEGTPRP